MEVRLREEATRARRYGRPLTVIVGAPDLLPGALLDATALTHAISAAKRAARDTDLIGWLDAQRVIMILPETSPANARVAAARWRNDIWLRSRGQGGRKWHVTVVDDPTRCASLEEIGRLIEQSEITGSA